MGEVRPNFYPCTHECKITGRFMCSSEPPKVFEMHFSLFARCKTTHNPYLGQHFRDGTRMSQIQLLFLPCSGILKGSDRRAVHTALGERFSALNLQHNDENRVPFHSKACCRSIGPILEPQWSTFAWRLHGKNTFSQYISQNSDRGVHKQKIGPVHWPLRSDRGVVQRYAGIRYEIVRLCSAAHSQQIPRTSLPSY